MDFLRYAESAAALLNADVTDVPALTEHLGGRTWLHDQVDDRDCAALVGFQAELRPVFVASGAGDVATVIRDLNALMERHPVTPMISDHDLEHLHLHVASRSASVSELLMGEALLGLATLVCDLGPTRLGVCAAAECERVYVDTSPSGTRRYCSDRCSSRTNVAAYRARQRAAVDVVVP